MPKYKCTLDMIVNGIVRRTFDLDAKAFYLVGACVGGAGGGWGWQLSVCCRRLTCGVRARPEPAGRDDLACDIVVVNDSISRQHAVIQFDEAGACYITDLGSTNGTFLNKKKLTPKVGTAGARAHVAGTRTPLTRARGRCTTSFK